MNQACFSLTNPQKSIWYTEDFLSGTNIGNICGTLIFKEKVQFKKLEQAVNLLIQNNDNFRLHFTLENQVPKQYVEDYKYVRLKPFELFTKKDLSDLEQRTVSTKFHLLHNNLYKFLFFKFSDNTGGFILNIHHLIADGWSFSILLNEIISYYKALLEKEEVVFKSYSYLDYVKKETDYLQSEQYQIDKDFWHTLYQEIPETAMLPNMKHTNYQPFSYQSKRSTFHLPTDFVQAIRDLCTQNHVSLFHFFMSVYSLYIHRITGLEKFAIGTPILNRSNFIERNTCGMFTSTIPFFIHIPSGLNFISYMKKVSQDSLSFLRHQKYPYHTLLTDLHEKNHTFSKLYSILLSYQNGFSTKDIDTKNYKIHWTSNQCIADSLNIHLYDLDPEKINISYDYQSSYYEEEDMVYLHNHILQMIGQIVKNPTINCEQLQILSQDEKQEILVDFNNQTNDFSFQSFVEMFQHNASKSPNNTAVIYQDKSLTYAQLDTLSNRLAHYLLQSGFQKGDVLAVSMPKDLEFVIALLSLYKIGAIYLPISTLFPQDRIAYILENSHAIAILTEEEASFSCQTINLHAIDYSSCSDTCPTVNVLPDDIAYIIYTSGSTGKPKGIEVTHDNLMNFINGFNAVFDKKFSTADSCLALTDISFDISLCELLVPLSYGSKLVLYGENRITDLEFLCHTISYNQITFLYLPPYLLNDIYENLKNRNISINKLLVGIAPIQNATLNQYASLNSKMEIINAYGTCETTIFSCFYHFHKTTHPTGTVPIGKPMDNSRIYILDAHGHIQPIGLKGEIFVAGRNVSKGYLSPTISQRDLFQEDPFYPGQTCYRTGDIGYWNPDGTISFVGRNDSQIKLRGYRIELEEITSVMQQIPGVENAITIVKEIHQTPYIVAYIQGPVEINFVKSYLKNKLPIYMIPAYFVKIAKIPVTLNGKIDKQQLPMVHTSLCTKLDPVNPLEESLLTMWKNILKIDDIGTNEDFFELGGDSLSAIRLLSQIKTNFDVTISIANIFSNSTIRSLATWINLHDRSNLLEIHRCAKQDYYPVSSTQRRLFYRVYRLPSQHATQHLTSAVLFDKLLDTKKIQDIFQYLIQRHSSFRTGFHIIDGELVQSIQENVSLKIPVHQSHKEDIPSILNHFAKPFDLAKPPLLRAEIYLIGNQTLIAIDTHPIVADQKSIQILWQELLELYHNQLLPTMDLDYKDYANWEYNSVKQNAMQANEEYWIQQFKSSPIPTIHLPYDYPKTNRSNEKGNMAIQSLEPEQFQNLLALAKTLDVSPDVLFLAAFTVLLYQYTQDSTIILGNPIDARYGKKVEGVIGNFVNMLPIKAHIRSHQTFQELLIQIQHTMVQNLEHQPYPYDLLVKKLNLSSSNIRHPLFDITFHYQPNNTADSNNYQFTLLEPSQKTSEYDLSVEVIEKTHEIRITYATALFKITTIRNLLTNYIATLQYVLNNVQTPIQKIDILSAHTKQTLLKTFCHTREDFPLDKTLVDLWEKQVQKSPEHLVVQDQNCKMTYQELNQKANQLAHYMQTFSIAPQTPIAIIMPKNMDLIVALLAVQKINCPFLLLSWDMPIHQINQRLKDCHIQYVLVENPIYEIECSHILFFDQIQWKNDKTENLNLMIHSTDLSHLIYTAGTTGASKGVTITHRNMINFLYGLQSQLEHPLDQTDRILSVANVSFDLFVGEVFASLLFGSTLFLYNPNDMQNIAYFYDTLQKNKITFVHIPANLLDDFYQYANQQSTSLALSKLLVGIELIKNGTLNAYYHLNPNMEIINGYGPAETTIFCTFFHHKKTRGTNRMVSIGKPCANNRIYIVNEDFNLQPIGVPGQICISGESVSPGYLREEWNQAYFCKNPFEKNTLLYQTGDYGYWDKNGQIHFIGRSGTQVKLKGFRIELNEISTAIQTIDEVTYATTVLKEIDSLSYICSYVKTSKPITKTYIREKLNDILPFYMIPAYIIFLENIPLTCYEKVDSAKLPLPTDFNLVKNSNIMMAPKSKREVILLHLFKQILHRNDIGTNHNFFELGGDSLSAVQLQTKALNENISLSYSDIFDYPTVEQLAEHSRDIDHHSMTTYDLENFKQFQPMLAKNALEKTKPFAYMPIQNVLLTGVTGFLGAHILESFLKQENGTLYCLIRPKNKQSAQERLIQTLHFYFGSQFDAMIGNRIQVVEGELTNYEFSLSEEDYHKLGKTVSTVIHAAALVKPIGEYQEFRDANIKGTHKIIDFCEAYHLTLWHISTTSVSGQIATDQMYYRQDKNSSVHFSEKDFYIGQSLDNLYIKSKFKAEQLVLDARTKGLSAYIIRVGNLTNRYSSGIGQPNHIESTWIHQLQALLPSGMIPKSLLNLPIELSPVDYTADAILKIATHLSTDYSVFHVFNPQVVHLANIYPLLQEQVKMPPIVEDAEFIRHLDHISNGSLERNPYLHHLKEAVEKGKLAKPFAIQTDCQFTLTFLQSVNFHWPKIDQKYLKKYLHNWIQNGYLDTTLLNSPER